MVDAFGTPTQATDVQGSELSPVPGPASSQASEVTDVDVLHAVVRLLVGGVVEGSDALLQRLQHWEARYGAGGPMENSLADATSSELARYVLVGLAFETSDVARQGLVAAWRASVRAGRLAWLPVRPLATGDLFAPLRRRLLGRPTSPADLPQRWAELGLRQELQGRRLVRDLFTHTIDEVVQYLSGSAAVRDLIQAQVETLLPELAQDPNLKALIQVQVATLLPELAEDPQLEALVQSVANDYIAYLQEHPELVEALIRDQGDRYVAYLHDENPEPVQDLIQGQSIGLATEVMDGVRERTVTSDTVLEAAVRALLRRRNREELPEPSPQVKARAADVRQPGDYPRLGKRSHD